MSTGLSDTSDIPIDCGLDYRASGSNLRGRNEDMVIKRKQSAGVFFFGLLEIDKDTDFDGHMVCCALLVCTLINHQYHGN